MSAKPFGVPLYSYNDFFNTKTNTRQRITSRSKFNFGTNPNNVNRPNQQIGFFQTIRQITRNLPNQITYNTPPTQQYERPLPTSTPSFFTPPNLGIIPPVDSGSAEQFPKQCLNIPVNKGSDEVFSIDLDLLAPCEGYGRYDSSSGSCDNSGVVGPNASCGGSPPCCQSGLMAKISYDIRMYTDFNPGFMLHRPSFSDADDPSLFDVDGNLIVGENGEPFRIIASGSKIGSYIFDWFGQTDVSGGQFFSNGALRALAISAQCPPGPDEFPVYNNWVNSECRSGLSTVVSSLFMDGASSNNIKRDVNLRLSIEREWDPCGFRDCDRASNTETCVGRYRGKASFSVEVLRDSYHLGYLDDVSRTRVSIRWELSPGSRTALDFFCPVGSATDRDIDPLCGTIPS